MPDSDMPESLSLDNAERYARNIREYWFKQGYNVPVRIMPKWTSRSGKKLLKPIYVIALPPFPRGMPPKECRIVKDPPENDYNRKRPARNAAYKSPVKQPMAKHTI